MVALFYLIGLSHPKFKVYNNNFLYWLMNNGLFMLHLGTFLHANEAFRNENERFCTLWNVFTQAVFD